MQGLNNKRQEKVTCAQRKKEKMKFTLIKSFPKKPVGQNKCNGKNPEGKKKKKKSLQFYIILTNYNYSYI